MPRLRRRPSTLRDSSTIRAGAADSVTRISSRTDRPGATTRMQVVAPTPDGGPSTFQSTMKWSLNGWWLASTFRYAKTSPRGLSIVTDEVNVLIQHLPRFCDTLSQATLARLGE